MVTAALVLGKTSTSIGVLRAGAHTRKGLKAESVCIAN